jgi:hypothetical protein
MHYNIRALPIFLVPHLEIFPTYNNIFIEKHRKTKKIMAEHVGYTNIKMCNPMFP